MMVGMLVTFFMQLDLQRFLIIIFLNLHIGIILVPNHNYIGLGFLVYVTGNFFLFIDVKNLSKPDVTRNYHRNFFLFLKKNCKELVCIYEVSSKFNLFQSFSWCASYQVVITSINIDGNLLLIGSHQKEKVGISHNLLSLIPFFKFQILEL